MGQSIMSRRTVALVAAACLVLSLASCAPTRSSVASDLELRQSTTQSLRDTVNYRSSTRTIQRNDTVYILDSIIINRHTNTLYRDTITTATTERQLVTRHMVPRWCWWLLLGSVTCAVVMFSVFLRR